LVAFLNLLNPHASNYGSRKSNRFDTGRLEEGVLKVIKPFKNFTYLEYYHV